METRKKKKDVLFMNDDDWKVHEAPRSDFLKAGSKRKLSVRDDDERIPERFNESDDFQYNLPTEKPREEVRKVKLDHAPRTTGVKSKTNARQGEEITARKPLGPSM